MSLYTFGQPRTGDGDLADYVFTLLPNNYLRVTHYDDMVAHVPPLLSGFQHAGNEVWYKSSNHDGHYIECANQFGYTENKQCSNSLFFKTGISAHVTYMGHSVSGSCTRRQPGGTLAVEMEEEFVEESAPKL